MQKSNYIPLKIYLLTVPCCMVSGTLYSLEGVFKLNALNATILILNIKEARENKGFPGGSDSKESAYNAGDSGLIMNREDPLEKGLAIRSSILV